MKRRYRIVEFNRTAYRDNRAYHTFILQSKVFWWSDVKRFDTESQARYFLKSIRPIVTRKIIDTDDIAQARNKKLKKLI